LHYAIVECTGITPVEYSMVHHADECYKCIEGVTS